MPLFVSPNSLIPIFYVGILYTTSAVLSTARALRDGDDRRVKLLRLDNVIVEHDDIVHQPQEVPDRRNDVISEAVSAVVHRHRHRGRDFRGKLRRLPRVDGVKPADRYQQHVH